MKRIFKYIFSLLSMTALSCLLYGFWIEPIMLVKREITIASPYYSGAPIKILLISDIHIGGPHITPKRLDSIIQKANQNGPYDVVLIPGDFINGHRPKRQKTPAEITQIEQGLNALGQLNGGKALLASLGNHDTWYSKIAVARTLKESGITVLDNDSLMSGEICFVGIADFDTDRPNVNAARHCSAESVKIIITHSPDALSYAPKDSALIVSGHTHGGQINLPLIGRRVTSTQAGPTFAYGLTSYENAPVFITAGIGTSILPARFRAPPEYVVITLVETKD